MSEQENDFLKKLQKTLWTAGGSLLVIVVIATIPFYFNTQNELSQHSKEIQDLKADKADRTVYEITIQQVKDQLIEMNRKIEKMQDKVLNN